MSKLFTKPAGMKYTDMCIYIDKHMHDPDRDNETIFKYIYLLASMLASKARYFYNADEYDDFAYYFACSVFKRMADDNKNKIKSVLNYMKSVIYFRKTDYLNEVYSQIIDPTYTKGWNEDLFKEMTISNMQSLNRYLLLMEVFDIINSIPLCIKLCIPNIYNKNSIMYQNIYKSVLLSMLSRYTLPQKYKEVLMNHRYDDKPFDDVEFYHKHLSDEDIILWYLPDSMRSTILIIISKVKLQFASDINEVIDEFKITDDEYNNLYTDIIFGVKDEKHDID